MSIYKTALIIEGGGSRGVFSFGVIDTFIKNQFDPFNLYIGVSNGAVVLNWYLIKEKKNNLEKMLFSANKQYVNYLNFFKGKSIIDFEAIYRDGRTKFNPDPFKIEKNLESKELYLAATEAVSAKAHYLKFNTKDWFDQMIASGTLPLIVRKPSIINKIRYFDGGIADPIPVKKAYDLGAKKIVVIRTYEEKFIRANKVENFISALFIAKYLKLSKALINHSKTYNRCLDFIQNPPDDCEIIQICPATRLKVKRDSIDHDLLKDGYQSGINSAVKFLDKSFNLFHLK